MQVESWRYPDHAPAGLDNEQVQRFCELACLFCNWLRDPRDDNYSEFGSLDARRIRGCTNIIGVPRDVLVKHIAEALEATEGEAGLIRYRLDDAIDQPGLYEIVCRRGWRVEA